MVFILEISMAGCPRKHHHRLPLRLFIAIFLVWASSRLYLFYLDKSAISMTFNSYIVGEGQSHMINFNCSVNYNFTERMVALTISSQSPCMPWPLNCGAGKNCDLFDGEWIPTPSPPAYAASCPFIERRVNCLKNGRPHTGYLYWKWKPRGCALSPFDPLKFLNVMRNKTWAFVGDSLIRQHAHSLLCLLSKVAEAEEVRPYGEAFKSGTWRIAAYNFTLKQIWSPFLAQAQGHEGRVPESSAELAVRLHIDALDPKWTEQYSSFDHVVASAGAWYTRVTTFLYLENGTAIACHNCPTLSLPALEVDRAYGKVLAAFLGFVAASPHKPAVLYRSWTPRHYEHGEWNSGGRCNRTAVYAAGEYGGTDVERTMRRVELEAFGRPEVATGARVRLLDTYRLMLSRPDAHPDRYWQSPEYLSRVEGPVVDCLHWCMPGAMDTWNDLVMELVINRQWEMENY